MQAMHTMHATQAMTMTAPRTDGRPRTLKTLRRLGVAGFVFFLVKGLLWLVIPAAMWMLRG
jgi:hypothetical protein